MSISESDSLWLQKSIHLADPIPEATGGGVETDENSRPGELLMVGEGMAKEVEELGGSSGPSSARFIHSTSQRASCRQSVSNASFASLHEIDELRARIAQLKREQLRWSGNQRELEIVRFELVQTQQELQTTREYARTLKEQLDEAEAKAEKEAKARRNSEAQLEKSISQSSRDKEFLKQQLEAMKEEHCRQLAEVEGRSEVEGSGRTEFMREQITKLTEDIEALDESNVKSREEACRLGRENELLRANIKSTQAKCDELQRSLESYTTRYAELENMHKIFVEKTERSQSEALDSLMATNNDRMKKIISSKEEIIDELREELKVFKGKSGSFSEEITNLQHRVRMLEAEAKQMTQEHEKELRSIRDQHHLALCQQQQESEILIREAKNGRVSLEEETSFLKRQAVKAAEELSAAAALIVQREEQLSHLESENITMRNALQAAERDRASAADKLETARSELLQAEERTQHLQQQYDLTETVYSQDMLELKEKLAAAQVKLMQTESELSAVRQEKMKYETEAITNMSDLRSKLEEAECDRKRLQHAVEQASQTDKQLEQLRVKYLTMCKRAENMEIELAAVTSRCSLLEKRLDEEFRRSVRNASHSPVSLHFGGGNMCLRGIQSTNVPPSASKQAKRSRSVEQRVFTISGFDGTELLEQIHKLPYATVAECKSNSPVPTNLTHLVTNGQLTVKLLTALVRGCWILPEAYVHESTKQKMWLDELSYGFRHVKLPIARKRIGFSEGFVSSRHLNTANLIIVEGGATVESNLTEADMILCTRSEYGNMENTRAVTWDKLVELIYPVKIGVVAEEVKQPQ
ncbi:Myosin-like protein [Trypanosoma equiperdum]|uniref:Myosin-like protein n=1 Tax=Trypanosoma equiperdum TaxID=5694 RepID=A0A1G4I925_TRYEQ|nr:Myosin-like protein [Trypanosoma equiperdum]